MKKRMKRRLPHGKQDKQKIANQTKNSKNIKTNQTKNIKTKQKI
jgi:hypothetical protein